jgi:4-hydroxyphenylpyruvate 3-dimethylallyltransferase
MASLGTTRRTFANAFSMLKSSRSALKQYAHRFYATLHVGEKHKEDAVDKTPKPYPSKRLKFNADDFKKDVSQLCATLNSGYNEKVMNAVLDTYKENFERGAVLWKATSKEDGIAFRFYEREKVDVVGTAINHGLIPGNHPMIPLITSWANFRENAIASCDFDPAKGLNKTWVWLGGRFPLEELLAALNVPDTLRSLEPKLKAAGLDIVRHAAVDWRSSTVNIYFWVPGPMTLPVVNRLTALSGAEPVDEEQLATIKPFFKPNGFTCATTIDSATGKFKRVAFYALRLDSNNLPVMGDRLATFFKEAPSNDKTEMNIVAWSFAGGPSGSSNYIKGERSYIGELEQVLKTWGSPIWNK